jgi:hypothetical protein
MKNFMTFLLFQLACLPSLHAASIMEAKCPEKILSTGSVEGVYQGNDCGDYCYSTLTLDDDTSFSFMCGEDESKKFFEQPGKRVSVTYEVRQFWSEFAEQCLRSEVCKSGKIIDSPAAGSGKRVEVMDPKMHIPIFSIELSQGWTHTADSTWDRKTDPFITYSMSARSPDGLETLTILPVYAIDAPMTPSQFGRFFIEQAKKTHPPFAALNYRIVEAWDFPPDPQSQDQVKLAKGAITGEYTENGVAKSEVVWISISSDGTAKSLAQWVALSGKRGDYEYLAQKMATLWNSLWMNPRWLELEAVMRQEFLAGKAREQSIPAKLEPSEPQQSANAERPNCKLL